jgi:hypothetical protein
MFLDWIRKVQKNLRRFSSCIADFFADNPYGLSALEVVFTLLISNASLFFLVFAHLVDTKGAQFSLGLAEDLIGRNVLPTEVLVYLLALITPALWIMAYNWRARRHVGFYWLLLMVQGAIVVGSAYIYGRSKSGLVANPEFVEHWSHVCLLLGLVIWYVTLVYNRTVVAHLDRKQPQSGQKILNDLGGAR